jgi:hypothetical protein
VRTCVFNSQNDGHAAEHNMTFSPIYQSIYSSPGPLLEQIPNKNTTVFFELRHRFIFAAAQIPSKLRRTFGIIWNTSLINYATEVVTFD